MTDTRANSIKSTGFIAHPALLRRMAMGPSLLDQPKNHDATVHRRPLDFLRTTMADNKITNICLLRVDNAGSAACGDGEGEGASNINAKGCSADSKAKQYRYKSPAHSESFLRHLESVKTSWPYDPNDGDSDDSEDGALDEKSDKCKSFYDGGVQCTGEPSIDPSRMLQVVLDGESDWI